MIKRYLRFNIWFLLSGIWLITAVLNGFSKRGAVVVWFDIAAVIVFFVLGITKNICCEKGDSGKKIMTLISGAVLLLLLLLWLFMMFFL